VRIVSGDHGVDGNFVGTDDAVVMDDFIFGEPISRTTAVSSPGALTMVGLGLALLGLQRRRAGRQRRLA
jgi:hypothetical protein